MLFRSAHQEIAAAIIALRAEERTADEITITERLRSAQSPVTGHRVSEMTEGCDFRAYSHSWAADIRRLAGLRSIQSFGQKLASHAADPNADPDALLAFAEGTVRGIGRTKPKDGPQRMDLADLAAFDRKADPDTVLGNRWLCKGGSLLIVEIGRAHV